MTDPRDYILRDPLLVDTGRFGALSSSATALAYTNPMLGATSLISAGSLAHTMLTPSTVFGSHTPVSVQYANTAIRSLAALNTNLSSVSALATLTPYSGAVSALVSGTGLAERLGSVSVKALQDFEPPRIASFLSDASYRVGVSDSLSRISFATEPYFASSNALLGLESRYQLGVTAQALSVNTAAFLPNVSSSYLTELHSGVVGLSSAATSITESFRMSDSLVANTSIDLFRAPGLELYAATRLSASVSLADISVIEDDDEVEEQLTTVINSFEARLGGLSRELVVMYRGGSEAIERGGTDWQRHALVSFRELVTHVLHLLSPDKELLRVVSPDDMHNGKPTRRARLRFIFRDQAGPEIAKFFEADLKAALELFDLLNNGTHRLDGNARKEQAHYLRGRVAGLVSSMLAAQGY